jgi:hypothetical protein
MIFFFDKFPAAILFRVFIILVWLRFSVLFRSASAQTTTNRGKDVDEENAISDNSCLDIDRIFWTSERE